MWKGRTDGRTVGHWYTIIRPVLKTGVWKLQHFDDINFREHFILIKVFFLQSKICLFLKQDILYICWHFKFHRVIGIYGLTVCILYGEISIFHSRVMGLYSSNCRRFFVCRTVNWEPLGQFTSNFALLLELIVFTDFSKNVVFVLNLQRDIRKIAYNLMNKVP
jgi:hypothetical protein